jgi:hypothetical protein
MNQINTPTTTPAIIKTGQEVQAAQTLYVEFLPKHLTSFTDTLLGKTRAFRSAAPCHW